MLSFAFTSERCLADLRSCSMLFLFYLTLKLCNDVLPKSFTLRVNSWLQGLLPYLTLADLFRRTRNYGNFLHNTTALLVAVIIYIFRGKRQPSLLSSCSTLFQVTICFSVQQWVLSLESDVMCHHG